MDEINIDKALLKMKETHYPVDYVQQYESIMERVEQQKRPLAFFFQKPLLASMSMLFLAFGVFFYSGATNKTDYTGNSSKIDTFMASVAVIDDDENQTEQQDFYSSFLDGTIE
ncbi:MAG TPA: hypothetical protein DCS13_12895 [Candidatus Margulisbacteria bacterium]|nr:MAG: hypothetical protein A2X43_04840 [Candidatus Margulisbacteria bacterium GWD2_39_127]HAR64355.1 hypothetical protein [Candidatus Margulisiibacteriota bacterium]